MVALRQRVRKHPGGGLLGRRTPCDVYAAASVETAEAGMMGDEVQADAPVQRHVLLDHELGGEVGSAEPFALYNNNQIKEARDLLSLVASKDAFERALLKVVRRHFDEPRWKPDW